MIANGFKTLDVRFTLDLIVCGSNNLHNLKEGLCFLNDNKSYKIIGIATIKFHLHDGTKRLLEEVRYVPNLKWDHISLGEL